MKREQLIQEIVKLEMDNPCLSLDIDYKPDSVRLKYYTEQVSTLTDEQLIQELEELRENLLCS